MLRHLRRRGPDAEPGRPWQGRRRSLGGYPGLTARGADISHHAAQSRADKENIHRCCISPRTVQNHLASSYAKLEVANCPAASLRAAAGG